jgi:dihydrofolate reductase
MNAIVAMTPERVIGFENKVPWRIPDELKLFKKITIGHVVLMGRKTFESIGKPLPGRTNLVISRAAQFPGVEMIRDIEHFDPARFAKEGQEVFVIGGAEIYERLLNRCHVLYVTRVHRECTGDSYFPEFESKFHKTEKIAETHEFDTHIYRRPLDLGVQTRP